MYYPSQRALLVDWFPLVLLTLLLYTLQIFTRNKGDRADVQNVVVALVNGKGFSGDTDIPAISQQADLLKEIAQVYAIGKIYY